MNLKIIMRAFFLLLFLTMIPMITNAQNDRELLDLAQKLFQLKAIPCTDNDHCYCLSVTATSQIPVRYTRAQFCAEKVESGHIVGALFKSWDQAGNKVDDGHFLNGKMDGQWIGWHPNGVKAAESNYSDGKQIGSFTTWHDNGRVEVKGQHKDDKANGEWLYWDKTGKLIKKLIWDNGNLISKLEIKSSDN